MKANKLPRTKVRGIPQAEKFVSRFHPRDESRGIIARNKKMKRLQKGLVPVLALIIIAILAVLFSAGAYYSLRSTGKFSEDAGKRPTDFTQEIKTSPEEVPVSDSDKTSDIEAELESTNIGEVELDIEQLDADAGSL